VRRRLGSALALTLAISCAAAAAQERRAILSLVQGEPGKPWTDLLTRSFVEVIGAAENSPTLYFEYVDTPRFEDRGYLDGLRDWLRFKYRLRRIDLIVIRGQEAVEFLARSGGEPWPDTPVLYTDLSGIPPEVVASLEDSRGLILEDHMPAALAVIKELFPGTERIALVYGGTSTERIRYSGYAARLRKEGFEFLDLGGLPMRDLLVEVARLPERTVILYFPIEMDAEGGTFPTEAACRMISDAANRPVFSLYRMLLGSGIVGGRLLDFSVWGEALGERALQVLDEPSLPTMSVPVERHSRLAFDARELERWNIDESRLPEGSTILFREPSLWRDYRPYVLAALAVSLVQALLIVGLLFERRRRHQAELAARRHLATLAHVDRRGAMGELAASIAHELGQPLAAILANAKAAELMLAAGPADLEEIRSILDDIRKDDVRAAEIIRGMRELLRKRELSTRSIDVNELARETAALVAADARSRDVELDLSLAPGAAMASGEPIYLQQVLLNLLLNAVAAVSSEPPNRRRVRVQTTAGDNVVETVVSDTGHGIPTEQLATIFEPFVTTKAEGLGVGLSIARSIVEAHGGRIEAANNPEGGATFRFTLPAPKRA
jgi:signal transduction histidine kinase